MPDMTDVKSSNIQAVGYDADASELHVTFKGGATHIYSDVAPGLHQDMLSSDSVGKFFHANVRNAFKSRPAGLVDALSQPQD